jgi:hypothetical protein
MKEYKNSPLTFAEMFGSKFKMMKFAKWPGGIKLIFMLILLSFAILAGLVIIFFFRRI